MDEAAEQRLINEAREGNQNAFGQLAAHYGDLVYTVALRILRNPQDAEEVAQDAFVKAWKNLKTFEGNAKFSTWLYRIVYNSAISATRKRKEEMSSLSAADVEHEYQTSVQETMACVTAEERSQFVKKALTQLSEEDSLILSLFYLAEKRIDEIVEITGWKESNVKVRLHRSRKRMYDVLEQLLKSEVRSIL